MSSPSVIIVGAREEETAILREQLGDMVEIVGVEPDPFKGLELARQHSPRVALLYLDKRLTLQVVALVFLVGMAVHLSMLALLPSLLFLMVWRG